MVENERNQAEIDEAIRRRGLLGILMLVDERAGIEAARKGPWDEGE